ncbi:hypothetical protein TNCV_1025831 [Trichonephila clavipes]|nr:hypothetical protein TNCV_1025831 [Trichonephila clavipes]
MKRFDQTPYKLPPPTPIHVPAEKRPLEEKSLPFSKKRSKVRITPVLRRVSRRSELPMAPVQIPQPPVQTPQIPHVPDPPVQIPVSQVPQSPVQIPPVHIPLVHIPDVPEHVQIPVSQVPQPPMQILHVSEPVQIPVSQVPQSPVQIPVSQVPSVTCAESPRTYADSPRARDFGPFGVDRCIRPAHVVRICTPRTPGASHGTLYF